MLATAILAGAPALPLHSAAGSAAACLPRRPVAEADAALLQAVERFQALHATVLAQEANATTPWPEIEATGAAWHDAARALCGIAPTTAEGLAAKAAAMAAVLRVIVGDYTHPERFDENAEVHHRLALDLALDIARLPGDAA